MFEINRIVITRLFLAWLIVSVLTGSAIYLLETRRMDEAIVARALGESKRFAAEGIEAKDMTPGRLAARRKRALEFIRTNDIVMERFDQQGKTLFKVENPDFENLKSGLAQQPPLPDDGALHYRKIRIDGQTLVQTQVPLKNRSGSDAGSFKAVFVIDRGDLSRLNAEVQRSVVIALLCVLCTTLLLYPVLISLTRRLIRFSDKVIRGNLEIVTVLGAAIAERDSDTGDHNFRVTLYAIRLAEAIGSDKVDMRALILGAFLHDVGKIGIRDQILHKPGELSDAEIATMRTHVQTGVAIIQTSEWLQAARDVIEYHHERFDGSGYLKGLRGEEIPLVARIFSVADVFDALTSKRPYKAPWSVDAALLRIENGAGSQFDPRLVAAFRTIAAAAYRDYGQADEAQLNACLRRRVKAHYRELVSERASA